MSKTQQEWTEELEDFVRTHYLDMTDEQLAQHLALATGVAATRATIYNRRMQMKLIKGGDKYERDLA